VICLTVEQLCGFKIPTCPRLNATSPHLPTPQQAVAMSQVEPNPNRLLHWSVFWHDNLAFAAQIGPEQPKTLGRFKHNPGRLPCCSQ
jgi:hypothetical protein